MSSSPEQVNAATLEALQTRLAYLEANQQDLSATLYEQQTRIDLLERYNAQLVKRVRELGDQGAGMDGTTAQGAEHERPPHY